MQESRPLKSMLVFCGDANHNVAQVYCALADDVPRDAVMRGTLRGPESRLTHTLPAKVDLEFLGTQPRPLARATVIDPCYWAPGEPYLYQLDLELAVAGRVVDHVQRTVGLRPAGVIGPSLRLSLRPWLVRGVQVTPALRQQPAQWRELKLAQVWPEICPEDWQVATEEGIPVVLRLSGNRETLRSAVRQCSKWPCCVLAILDSDQPLDASLRELSPNLLFAQPLRSPAADTLADWAHAGVCELAGGDESRVQGGRTPLILSLANATYDDLNEAAAIIDSWQREADAEQAIAGVIV